MVWIVAFYCVALTLALFTLITCYMCGDFSIYTILTNSNANTPLLFQLSATWSNHEGSLLLWCWLFSVYGFLFCYSVQPWTKDSGGVTRFVAAAYPRVGAVFAMTSRARGAERNAQKLSTLNHGRRELGYFEEGGQVGAVRHQSLADRRASLKEKEEAGSSSTGWGDVSALRSNAHSLLHEDGARQPNPLIYRAIHVYVYLALFLAIFLLSTSNPFLRIPFMCLNSVAELNPVLQDPILAIHPPCIYAGYVACALVFSMSLSRWMHTGPHWAEMWIQIRVWGIIAWCFFTVGILLGSWWAYHELGWGGWWFWDPVENASLMPWLIATACIHSVLVPRNNGWTLFLNILIFVLSICGTFFVRSGLLASVHSFATDSTRGLFILCFVLILLAFSANHFVQYSYKIASLFHARRLALRHSIWTKPSSRVPSAILYDLKRTSRAGMEWRLSSDNSGEQLARREAPKARRFLDRSVRAASSGAGCVSRQAIKNGNTTYCAKRNVPMRRLACQQYSDTSIGYGAQAGKQTTPNQGYLSGFSFLKHKNRSASPKHTGAASSRRRAVLTHVKKGAGYAFFAKPLVCASRTPQGAANTRTSVAQAPISPAKTRIEQLLLLQNVLLCTICAVVMCGTAAPICFQALCNRDVSTGAPFFNGLLVPIFTGVLLVLIYVHSAQLSFRGAPTRQGQSVDRSDAAAQYNVGRAPSPPANLFLAKLKGYLKGTKGGLEEPLDEEKKRRLSKNGALILFTGRSAFASRSKEAQEPQAIASLQAQDATRASFRFAKALGSGSCRRFYLLQVALGSFAAPLTRPALSFITLALCLFHFWLFIAWYPAFSICEAVYAVCACVLFCSVLLLPQRKFSIEGKLAFTRQSLPSRLVAFTRAFEPKPPFLAMSMKIAHASVVLFITGVLVSNSHKIQLTQIMRTGDEVQLGKLVCCLRGIDHNYGPTYRSICGNVVVYPLSNSHNAPFYYGNPLFPGAKPQTPLDPNGVESQSTDKYTQVQHTLCMFPEKRFCVSNEELSTTKVAIHTNFFSDCYANIGAGSVETGWFLTVMHLPYIVCIWLAFGFAAIGGLISLRAVLKTRGLHWQ